MTLAAPPKSVIAVILAGGAARRLGGVAKASLAIGGITLLERVQAALAPQAKTILLSIAAQHMDAPWAADAKLPIVTDPVADAGPLGGIAGALVWARAYAPHAAAVISVPVDVPFLPPDLIARLTEKDGLAVAQSGDQSHHAIAAWPLVLADDVLRAVGRGEYAIHRWQEQHAPRVVSWPTAPYDPFLNINTPDDLRRATEIARSVA